MNRGALSLICFCIFFLTACKSGQPYTLSRLSAKANCSCENLEKSIKFLKKTYKSEKSLELYEGILIPVEMIDDEEYVYAEFNTLIDCLDMEFKPSEDGYYQIISKAQWDKIKVYRCE